MAASPLVAFGSLALERALGNRHGDEVHAEEYCRVANLAGTSDRFDLDPGDVVRIERVARDRCQDIVAVCHSHPDGPATLSQADRQGAWPGLDQVIAGLRRGRLSEVRVWAPTG